MSDSSQGKKPTWGRLRPAGLSRLFRRSSSQMAQAASSTQQVIATQTSQPTQTSTSVPRSTSPNNAPDTSPIPISQAAITSSSVQAPPVTESTVGNVPSLLQDNPYTTMGGWLATAAMSESQVRAKEVGSVAYEGVKLTLQALSNTAGMCPPLKMAVAGLLTIIRLVDVCGLVYTLSL